MDRTVGVWVHATWGWANYLFWTGVVGVFIALAALNPADRLRRGGLLALRWCWGRLLWWTNPFWWRDVRGLEHLGPGPYVIVANHQSVIDIPCLYGLPTELTVSARTGIFHVPIMGRFLGWSGQVDTGRFFDQGAEALAAGVSVVVFAEGSRSPDGELQRFHAGAFQLAERTGTAILPVAMDGARFILPKRGFIPTKAVVTVQVRVLEPIPPVGDASLLSDRTRDALQGGLDRIRSGG